MNFQSASTNSIFPQHCVQCSYIEYVSSPTYSSPKSSSRTVSVYFAPKNDKPEKKTKKMRAADRRPGDVSDVFFPLLSLSNEYKTIATGWNWV